MIANETDQAIMPGLLEIERWLSIQEWPGYEVSDFGRVKSFVLIARKHKGFAIGTVPRFLLLNSKVSGHPYISMSGFGKSSKKYQVHRLVLEAFVGPCPDGMEGCHNDGNPANNRLSNLRWDTHVANGADMRIHGRSQAGSRHNMAKLTESDIVEIFRKHSEGASRRQLRTEYGVSRMTIQRVLTRERWKHVVIPGLDEIIVL